jgi:hypothetical protein
MKAPPPLLPGRIRTLPKSFSWIDRRLLTEPFLVPLAPEEIALYFFLVTAADRQGMSFWSPGKIQDRLGLAKSALRPSIYGLIEQDLIAYRPPFFQVLSLPQTPFGAREAKP